MTKLINSYFYVSLSFGLRAFNNLIIVFILARIIGLSNFGLLNYLITIVTILITISDYGYRAYISKEVAARPTEVNLKFLVNKFTLKLIILSIMMCLLVLMLFSSGKFSTHPWTNVPRLYIIGFCFCSLFIDASNFIFSFFHSRGEFNLESRCLMYFTGSIIIGVLFTYLFGRLRYFIAFYFLGSILMFVSSWRIYKRLYRLKLNNIYSLISSDKILKEAKLLLPFAIITIGEILFMSLDIIVLQNYAPVYDLGVYFACLKIILVLSVFSIVTYTILVPDMSKIVNNSVLGIRGKLTTTYLLLLLSGILITGIYYFFSDSIVQLLFGSDFCVKSQYNINQFDWHIILQSISRYLLVIPGVFLLVSGNHWLRAKIILGFLIFSFGIHLYYIPKYGMLAAMNTMTILNISLAILLSISFIYVLSTKYYPSIRKP